MNNIYKNQPLYGKHVTDLMNRITVIEIETGQLLVDPLFAQAPVGFSHDHHDYIPLDQWGLCTKYTDPLWRWYYDAVNHHVYTDINCMWPRLPVAQQRNLAATYPLSTHVRLEFTVAQYGADEGVFVRVEATQDGAPHGWYGFGWQALGVGDYSFTQDFSGSSIYGLTGFNGLRVYVNQYGVEPGKRNAFSIISCKFLTAPTKTTFYAYREDEKEVLVYPYAATALVEGFSGVGAELCRQHITDMRAAIERLVATGAFINPITSNPYNWTPSSVDNLYFCAMGDRTEYGATGGARYDWTRTGAEMIGTETFDIDIGEIHECVSLLEAAS
jgi:hypothetical protein